MKPDEFLKLKKSVDEWTDKLLFEKSKEYGTNDDRFDNIRAISRISGVSIETCLKVLASKHIASCFDLLDGKLEPKDAVLREKFGDSHNYLYISEAILREFNEQGTSGMFHYGNENIGEKDVPLTYEEIPLGKSRLIRPTSPLEPDERMVAYYDEEGILQVKKVKIPLEIPQEKKVNIEILNEMKDIEPEFAKIVNENFFDLLDDKKIPIIEMTQAELNEELRKSEIRKKANEMFNRWNKAENFTYFLDNCVIEDTKYLHIEFNFRIEKLTLHDENMERYIGYLARPTDRTYIRIFERLLTDPKTFIKSYFGV